LKRQQSRQRRSSIGLLAGRVKPAAILAAGAGIYG